MTSAQRSLLQCATAAVFKCDAAKLLHALDVVGVVGRGTTLTLEAQGFSLVVAARKLLDEHQVRLLSVVVPTTQPALGRLTLDYDQLRHIMHVVAGDDDTLAGRLVHVRSLGDTAAELHFDGHRFDLIRMDRYEMQPNSAIVARETLVAAIPPRFEHGPLPGWRRTLAMDVHEDQLVVFANDHLTTTVNTMRARTGLAALDLELNLPARDVASVARLWCAEAVHISWTSATPRSVTLCCGDITLQVPSSSDDHRLRRSLSATSDVPVTTVHVSRQDLLNALRECGSAAAAVGDVSPSVFLGVTKEAMSLRRKTDGAGVAAQDIVIDATVERPDDIAMEHVTVYSMLDALREIQSPLIILRLRAADDRITISSANPDEARERHVIVHSIPPW